MASDLHTNGSPYTGIAMIARSITVQLKIKSRQDQDGRMKARSYGMSTTTP